MAKAAKVLSFEQFCEGYSLDPDTEDRELLAATQAAYEEYLIEHGGDVHQSWDPDGSKRAAAMKVTAARAKERNEREPVNDTGKRYVHESMRLHGTPIPEDWTLNSGDTVRPMEEGMEVRLSGLQVFRVVSANPTAAQLEGFGYCYLFSHSAYRRLRSVDERGIDSDTYSVLDYVSRSRPINRQGEDNMATAKVAGVPVSKGKATKAAPAAKVAREKKEKVVRDCICGCGGQTGSAFVPGHDARFKGWLGKIAKGQGKPTDYMSSSLAQRLGPWTDKGEGKVPTKTYKDLLN